MINYPLKIAFKNVMRDVPLQPVELKHSSSGYLWIGAGESVVHVTDINHPFELRDAKHKSQVTVRLQLPGHDEM